MTESCEYVRPPPSAFLCVMAEYWHGRRNDEDEMINRLPHINGTHALEIRGLLVWEYMMSYGFGTLLRVQ